jgi:branched-chain amino acid transport system permease protein
MSATQIFIENFLQALAVGIMVGGIYGLMCLGLSFIFGIMRVINFAQGDFMMLGMYAAYYLVTGFGILAFMGVYIGPFVGAILAGPILFVFGFYLHKFLVSRVTGIRVVSAEAEGHYAQLILTLGLALILQNGALLIFSSQPVSIRTPLSINAWELGPFMTDGMPVLFNQSRAIACLLAVAVACGLFVFMSRARLGKSLRAAADNPEAAIYMGIDVDRAHRIAFGIGTGIEFVVIMYAGVVLGGLGSTMGAFMGGMVIGLVQQLSTLFLPHQLQNTAIFAVFVLIMMFRPQGLFGRTAERA